MMNAIANCRTSVDNANTPWNSCSNTRRHYYHHQNKHQSFTCCTRFRCCCVAAAILELYDSSTVVLEYSQLRVAVCLAYYQYVLLMCVSAVCMLFVRCRSILVCADVCTYAKWDAGVTALFLRAVFRPCVRCSWSAVSALLHCVQVCCSLFALSVSRVFYSEGCAGKKRSVVCPPATSVFYCVFSLLLCVLPATTAVCHVGVYESK